MKLHWFQSKEPTELAEEIREAFSKLQGLLREAEAAQLRVEFKHSRQFTDYSTWDTDIINWKAPEITSTNTKHY